MQNLRMIAFCVLFVLAGIFEAHSAVNYNVIRDWYLKIPSPADLSAANTSCDHEVFSMVEFQGNLYIGMYAAQNACQSSTIYKWDGQAMTKFKSFVNGNHFQQVILAVFNNKLYVGVGGDNLGDGDVYVWDPLTDLWTKSWEDTTHYRVHSMQVYNGKLYAGFGYLAGNADVYEFNGSNWVLSFDGNSNQALIEAMTVHDGKLIIGGGKGGTGDFAFIYQFDGATWTPFYDPLGSGNNSVLWLTSFEGKLYAAFQSTSNPSGDDVRLWDGTVWTTIFDNNNVGIAHGPIAYNGRLYVTTTPVSGGGQVFRYDGVNLTNGWTQVFQATAGEQEAFFPYIYDGELLVGYGFDYLEANVYAFHEILGVSPVANAGADIEKAADQDVILDASQSSDSDGTIVNYQWVRMPDNQTVCTNTAAQCQTKTLGRAEEVIELTVTDNHGNTDKDRMSIYHTRVLGAVCGNDVVETGEICDGNSTSCLTSANYVGQQLCNATCSGFEACVSTESCGDLMVNGLEVCDGGNQVCTTPQGYAGTQTCNNQCSGYDLCVSALSCGDGIVNGAEVCDGSSQSCVTGSGNTGTQVCNAQCTGYDVCTETLSCGDGIVNGAEVCDGDSQSCVTSNGYAGTEMCNAQCTGYDVCTSSLSCGDLIINGSEVCDGGSQSCVTASGYAGTQVCNTQCDGFDTCTSTLSCGDGICSSPETSTTCAADCPPFNVILEAEQMTTKTTGQSYGSAWNIYTNGYIESTVDFPETAMYRFEIIAKATPALGVWANMDLRIDQVKKASFTVNSTGYQTYTVNVSVAQGSRRVAIAFTNDRSAPPEDRNLIVDKVIITK